MKLIKDFIIGVVTYNRYDYLDELIEDIYSQSILPKEIIISDNGEGYKLKNKISVPVTIIKNSYNYGTCRGANQIFKLSNGNDILNMCDDNYFVDQYSLEKIYNKFRENAYDLLLCNNWASFMCSKKWLKCTGELDENIWPCFFEDSDYTQRIRKNVKNEVSHNCGFYESLRCVNNHEETEVVGNKRGTAETLIVRKHNDLVKRSFYYYLYKWNSVKFFKIGEEGSLHDDTMPLSLFQDGNNVDVLKFEIDFLKNKIRGNTIQNIDNKIFYFVDEILKLKELNFENIIEIGTSRAYCSRLLLLLKPTFLNSYDEEFNLCHDIIKHFNYLLDLRVSVNLKNLLDLGNENCDLLVINEGYFNKEYIEKINFKFLLFFGKKELECLPFIELFVEGEEFNMYLYRK